MKTTKKWVKKIKTLWRKTKNKISRRKDNELTMNDMKLTSGIIHIDDVIWKFRKEYDTCNNTKLTATVLIGQPRTGFFNDLFKRNFYKKVP